ncbi:exonuclease SbcCD subunit D [Micrococcoides hystricis]|uniref:Nuclease SbcCD subunit D n=2 Tax=Micrococcoides hystricis TaxID=1572761 RepID=A0ABV6PBV7_9MICC
MLHTADWHLGRSFHKVGIDDVQRAGLQEILDLIERKNVDVLVVSGDIFDRAIPSAAAVANYNWMIGELVARGVPAIMSSGNHDSAERLGVARAATALGGIHLYTAPDQVTEPVRFDMAGTDAPLYIYAVPYLDPRAYATLLGTEMSHQALLEKVSADIAEDLAQRRQHEPGAQAVCLAHVFAQGAVTTESERSIAVGGIESVSADVFAPFIYTALGHLHRPQIVAGEQHIRYSGSLTKFSFSEVHNNNQVVLVDFHATENGSVAVEKIWTEPLSAQLPLAVLSGSFSELTEQTLVDQYAEHFVQLTLVDDDPPTDAYRQLTGLYRNVLDFRRQRLTPREAVNRTYQDQLAEVTTDEEICQIFYTHVTGRDYDEQTRASFNDALETVRAQLQNH